jgi:hypothetical protein
MKRFFKVLLIIIIFTAVNTCCENDKKVELTFSGPLDPPFDEILPNADKLYIDLFFGEYRISEGTHHYSDGSRLHERFIGNEDSFTVPDENIELAPVSLVMSICVYPNEGQASKAIQEEKRSKWWNENRNEYYAKWIELPAEDIVGYTHFWKEPGDNPIQGNEEVYFRVGQFVGHYSVSLDNPPFIMDGYIMPRNLSDLLEAAIRKTDIAALHDFQTK